MDGAWGVESSVGVCGVRVRAEGSGCSGEETSVGRYSDADAEDAGSAGPRSRPVLSTRFSRSRMDASSTSLALDTLYLIVRQFFSSGCPGRSSQSWRHCPCERHERWRPGAQARLGRRQYEAQESWQGRSRKHEARGLWQGLPGRSREWMSRWGLWVR